MYSGDLSLRGVWVRLRSLSADAPLWASLRDAEERAIEVQRTAAIDDALNRYR